MKYIINMSIGKESENFFEPFDNEKLSEMIIRAWEIADKKALKKYGKKIKKLGKEDAQDTASEVLDDFKIQKGEPTRLEYRADIIDALMAGDRSAEEDKPKTARQEIGYS